jgi:type IV secretory pathway TrbD component
MTPLLTLAPAAVVFLAGLAAVRAPLVEKVGAVGVVVWVVALVVVVP